MGMLPDRLNGVTDGNIKQIGLDKADCVVVSKAGKRAIRVFSDRVELADFEKVMGGTNWSDARLATVPQAVSSAFFIGDTEQIVTTDSSYTVSKWGM
ncbi:hypothetical protein [Neorhizobium alkalisoli]|uniref:hypothetical protein n=1 Tax=Neorhizobium alkalisoli TaxID=528178 RepID=UPI000CF9EFA6|nr:hypothetical protein [Neorhizobium alkalisoli]